MATDKYPEHKAPNPFFDVVMKGLNGLVDGENYYDAIAEDAKFEFLYRFPGWAEVVRGRENLIAAYSGYGNNIVLEKADGFGVHHDKERGVYAKRIVPAVGGKPEGIALQNDGRTHSFGLDPTQKVEHLVINFEQFLSKFIYTSVSNISSPTEELEKNVETAFAQSLNCCVSIARRIE